jgi:hypothetical protein
MWSSAGSARVDAVILAASRIGLFMDPAGDQALTLSSEGDARVSMTSKSMTSHMLQQHR